MRRTAFVLCLLAGSAARGECQTVGSQEPPRTIAFELDDHPRLSLGRAIAVDFTAKFDVDSEAFGSGIGNDPQMDLARRRIGVSGSLFRIFKFEIERELGDDDPWRDVFVAARMTAKLSLKAGKFKAPFSRAQLTGSHKLDFVHRPLAATALSPGRQIGVLAEGRLGGKAVGYELGLFSEAATPAQPAAPRASGEPMVAARVTARPFRKRHQLFEPIEIGIAGTIGNRKEGLDSVAGRTFADRRRFFPAMYVSGSRRRTGYELSWAGGPVALTAEYLRVWDAREQQGIRGQHLPDLVADGWYVSTVWLVAGERRANRLPVGVTPVKRGGLELGFRVEELRFGSAAQDEPAFRNPRAVHVLGNADRAMTLGATWYASRFARVLCNTIRERVADGERSPTGSSRPFWTLITRLQLHL